MSYSPNQWALFFFLYCFFGWLWETFYVSAKSKSFVNRGFLHGPFLPIYGSGAIVVLVSTMAVRDNLFLVYIFGMIGATILEYFTGAAMEKLFGVRYWDYSKNKFNLNGHICLFVSLAWGVFSLAMVQFIHPPLERLVLGIPMAIVDILAMILTVTVAIDATVSFREAMDLKEMLEKLAESNEEIRKIQSKMDFVYALAEDDLTKFVEKSEEKAARFKDRIELNLDAARARRHAKLDRISEEVMSLFAETAENMEIRQQYLESIEEQRRKIRERSNTNYLRSSQILKRNPGAVSKLHKEELAEILELLRK